MGPCDQRRAGWRGGLPTRNQRDKRQPAGAADMGWGGARGVALCVWHAAVWCHTCKHAQVAAMDWTSPPDELLEQPWALVIGADLCYDEQVGPRQGLVGCEPSRPTLLGSTGRARRGDDGAARYRSRSLAV